MAPALRIPLSVNMGQFKQGMEEARSVSAGMAKFAVQQFLSLNKTLALTGVEGAANLTKIGASAAQLVSPLKAAEVAAKGVSLAISGAAAAGGTALATGVVGKVVASAAPWIAVKLGWVAAIGAIVGAVHEARKQLEEMANVAEKASKAGVSAEFWQQFTAEAKKAKISVDELQAGLVHAWQATKDMLNPDWTVWDKGLTKISAVEKALRELRELFTTDQKFTGFDLFRTAPDQEAKNRAVLVAMTEIEAIGKRVAAQDLGEKMFGAKFADDIRQGKTSAEELLATMDRVKASGEIAFSNKLVAEAKELDRQLKIAHETLEQNLRPAWDGLATAALTIKAIWVEIVGLLAKAAALVEVFSTKSAIRQFQTERAEVERRLADPAYSGFAAQQQLLRRKQKIDTELAGLDAQAGAKEVSPADMEGMFPTKLPGGLPINPPYPTRLPHDLRKKEKEKKDPKEDPFDRNVANINKQITAMIAEATTIGLSVAAQQQLRAEMSLLEAARRSGTEVTDEQIAAYARLRGSMTEQEARTAAGIKLNEEDAKSFSQVSVRIGEVAAALEKVKDRAPLANFARDAQNLDKSLTQLSLGAFQSFENGFADIVTGTKSVSDAFRDMANSIIRDLIKIAVRQSITGPLASALFSAFGGGGISSAGAASLGGSASYGAADKFFDYPGQAEGGPVEGPGTSTSDSVPRMLSKGEFVVRASQAAPHRSLLEAINAGKLSRMAQGGFVSRLTGERNPETVNLPRGAQVIPNNIARRGEGGGNWQVNIHHNIDASGADQAAIARLERGLSILNRSIPNQVRAGIQNAGYGQQTGVQRGG